MRGFAACVLNAILLAAVPAAGAEPLLFRVAAADQQWEGTPVAGVQGSRSLLLRDGRLLPLPDRVHMQEVGRFSGYSVTEMRGQLQREFGRSFEVLAAGPYLIVQPQGIDGQWVQRFDGLYRSFQVFFRLRGLEIRPPRFPLVAVVLPSQQEFIAYAQSTGAAGLSAHTLGYYSPTTNRVALYDQSSRLGAEAWTGNEATIMHEASHQIAFNVGLHSRYALPPRWLVEGMGCLFEAPGVWNSTLHPRQKDRLNVGRVRDFQQFSAHRTDGLLPAMLADDDALFLQHPQLAYAEAWAFTFFLLEQEPKKLLRLLKVTASRRPDRIYGPQDRLREFARVFGDDWGLLEARYLRFMAQFR